MKKPRVLVGASISSKTHLLIPPLVKAIRSFSYQDKEVLLLENGNDKNFFSMIKEAEGISIEKTGAMKNEQDAIMRDRELLRKRLVEKNFDYLLSLGLGVVPPADVIERLLANNKDICTGVFFGHNVQKTGEQSDLEILHRVPVPALARFTDRTEDCFKVENYRFPEVFPSRLMEVDLASLNCMLINRKAVEGMDFVYNAEGNEDLLFALKCREHKLKIFADTGIVCGYIRHYSEEHK